MRVPDQVFISHNKADKEFAKSLAIAFVEQGVNVWFDDWNLKPGDSLTEGIGQGVSQSDVILLVWSKNAAKSKWVKAELRGSIYRHIDEGGVRVVPVILDNTPLPSLIADLKGLKASSPQDAVIVAAQICGNIESKELARRLQDRFFEVLELVGSGPALHDYKFCPECGSMKLEGWQDTDVENDRMYAGIRCKDCRWNEGGEV